MEFFTSIILILLIFPCPICVRCDENPNLSTHAWLVNYPIEFKNHHQVAGILKDYRNNQSASSHLIEVTEYHLARTDGTNHEYSLLL